MCIYKQVEYSMALAKLQNHTKSYNSASSSAGPSDHHSSMEAEAARNSAPVLGNGYGKFSIETSYERPRKRPVKFHILFPTHSEKIGEEQDLDGSGSRSTYEEEDFYKSTNNHEDRNITRKKLRLSKEQSSLLESSFKEHSTLTPIQKQELASQLKLRPRQVEVWFQNRRARTKLKQTEVDCEYLKKCCESLSEENMRLKKELLELRSIKLGSPFLIQLPRGPTNISMCPSCQEVSPVGGKNSTKTFYGAVKDASMAF